MRHGADALGCGALACLQLFLLLFLLLQRQLFL